MTVHMLLVNDPSFLKQRQTLKKVVVEIWGGGLGVIALVFLDNSTHNCN